VLLSLEIHDNIIEKEGPLLFKWGLVEEQWGNMPPNYELFEKLEKLKLK
jgi:hypothetical protein